MAAPPFRLTALILRLVGVVERHVGRLEGLKTARPEPRLRKENRVRTIQGSVAIEGNTMSLEQVTAVLEGKRVLGSPREILEVQNANVAYEQAASFCPWSERDILRAHRLLMANLLPDAGAWRKENVGVLQGSKVAHVAPPAKNVRGLMSALFQWLKNDETHGLVKACVAHYEIQFIHPFSDGNGRMGRLWQHVAMLRVSPLFEFAPVESLIRENQQAYYDVLGQADKAGESTAFVEFSLGLFAKTVEELARVVRKAPDTSETRLEFARSALKSQWFTRADYLRLHKDISTATASRDLRWGLDGGALRRRGERRLAEYLFA